MVAILNASLRPRRSINRGDQLCKFPAKHNLFFSLPRLFLRFGISLKVKAENGLVRILKKEGVGWVSTFPSTVINNACGEESVRNLMMRTERFAVAVADGFSRCSNGKAFGVCSVQGGMNAVGAHVAYAAVAQAYQDSTPLLCVTDGIPQQISGTVRYDITEAFRSITKWVGYINEPHRVPEFMTRCDLQFVGRNCIWKTHKEMGFL
jgi:glyoxylate carboligase